MGSWARTEAGAPGRGRSHCQGWDRAMRGSRKLHIARQAGLLHAADWPVSESHSYITQTRRSPAADRCCQQRSFRLQGLAPHCCCPQQPRQRQPTPRAEHRDLAAPDLLATPSPSAAAMLQRSAVHKRPPAALPGAEHAPRGLRQRLMALAAAQVLRRQWLLLHCAPERHAWR